MSRLYFAPLSEAFYLGSDQIKDTQAEIAKLKTLIGDSTLSKKTVPSKDTRVGYSDTTSVSFNKPQNGNNGNELDLLKVIQHPKFEEIVKNYIIVKHPEWVNGTLNSTEFVPNKQNVVKETFENLKQTFGNSYSTTVCSNIQNYLMFFIVTLSIYLFLKMVLKN